MLKAIVFALMIAAGLLASPNSEKEITTASAATQEPCCAYLSQRRLTPCTDSHVVLVTLVKHKATSEKEQTKKKSHVSGTSKHRVHHYHHTNHKTKHHTSHAHAKIFPSTAPFHLTAQPPCA